MYACSLRFRPVVTTELRHLPKVLRVSILLAKEERNEEESSQVTKCNVAVQYVNFVG